MDCGFRIVAATVGERQHWPQCSARVEDIEAERLAEYDAKGLRGLTKKLVAKLARKKHRATRVDDAAP